MMISPTSISPFRANRKPAVQERKLPPEEKAPEPQETKKTMIFTVLTWFKNIMKWKI